LFFPARVLRRTGLSLVSIWGSRCRRRGASPCSKHRCAGLVGAGLGPAEAYIYTGRVSALIAPFEKTPLLLLKRLTGVWLRPIPPPPCGPTKSGRNGFLPSQINS